MPHFFNYFKSNIKNLTWPRGLILALLLRLLVMPFTGHWDLIVTHSVAAKAFTSGIFSFYTGSSVIYPPFTFLSFALWQAIISPFTGPDFHTWLSLPLQMQFVSDNAFRYFFWMKLFYLPFDLGTAYFLGRFGKDKKESKLLSALWLFNPVVIYVVYMWGSIDIIPTFFAVMAVYLLTESKGLIPFLLFGIGAMYKIWPLILAPAAALIRFSDTKNRIISTSVSLLPLTLLSIVYMRIPEFSRVVFGSDRIAMFGNAVIYIGMQQHLLLVPLGYFLILLFLWTIPVPLYKLPEIVMAVLLFLFSLSAFTPQWILWLLPFLLVTFVRYPRLRTEIFFSALTYSMVLFTFDASLSVGLFAPVEPTLLDIPVIKDIITTKLSDPGSFYNLVRTVNSAVFIWTIYKWKTLSFNNK